MTLPRLLLAPLILIAAGPRTFERPKSERELTNILFCLDVSGSMGGQPIEQSKAAMRRALRSMQPGDSFQIVRFSNSVSTFSAKPVEATQQNIERGLQFIESLNAGGGTMLVIETFGPGLAPRRSQSRDPPQGKAEAA